MDCTRGAALRDSCFQEVKTLNLEEIAVYKLLNGDADAWKTDVDILN